ncbi:MAG TPA: hypothetical protein VH914_04250 [Acidimicrobiia bacterium]|jgi:acetyl esterase/lipase|nr:hypothetical protein [Acidimicrobiia bacterium]
MTRSRRSASALLLLILASVASCRAPSHAASRASTAAPTAPASARPATATHSFDAVESHFTVDRPMHRDHPTLSVFVVAPVGRRPFPLIVFSHGFQSIAELHAPTLTGFARNGYVVLAPNYPDADYRTHPADISLVLNRVTGERSPLREGFHAALSGTLLGTPRTRSRAAIIGGLRTTSRSAAPPTRRRAR